jgi:hypothetical protein
MINNNYGTPINFIGINEYNWYVGNKNIKIKLMYMKCWRYTHICYSNKESIGRLRGGPSLSAKAAGPLQQ